MNHIYMAQQLEFAGSSLSLIFNIVLIYLIYFHSRKEYGDYKILMLCLVALYICYSAIEVIVLPSYFVHEYSYLLFTTSHTEYIMASQLLMVTFCAMFVSIQLILAIQFVYRYLSVTISINAHRRDKLFKGYRHLIWMTVTLIYFTNWFLVGFFVFGYTTEVPVELSEVVQSKFNRKMESMSYTLVNYAKLDKFGVFQPNYKHIVIMSYLITCATIPILISLYCGIKTWLKMQSRMYNKSARTQLQEKQLFHVLIIQFIVPFICNTIPMLIVFLSPAFHLSPEPYTNYICMLIPFYPAFDAIATVIIIRDYAREILKIIGLSRLISNSSSSNALTSLKMGSNSVTARPVREF